MAGWEEMATALPEVSSSSNQAAVSQAPGAPNPADPQSFGWIEKSAYNYDVYNKSAKEIDESKATFEANGIEVGDWAGNAEVYKWDDEYGDVGPKFPALEIQLFGGSDRTVKGIDYAK